MINFIFIIKKIFAYFYTLMNKYVDLYYIKIIAYAMINLKCQFYFICK